uniref:Uncharacterized protein n=1 Tax=Anguilla anguilla TaxID=7936 RepID=A0A0E9RQY7_ANGAN
MFSFYISCDIIVEKLSCTSCMFVIVFLSSC